MTCAPLSASANRDRPRRAAAAEDGRAGAAQRCAASAEQGTLDVGVRAEPAAVAGDDRVDRADAPRERRRSRPRTASAWTLNGAVMLDAARRERAGEDRRSRRRRGFERQVGGVETERGESGVVHDRRP